jgi:AhpD family alkylhydroperoxidase
MSAFVRAKKPGLASDPRASASKQLIALGVAAQIPCEYCIYAHNKAARAAGATDAEIKEAISAAALVRKWSTELNGNMYDMSDFRKQVDAIYQGAKTQ